MQLLSNTNELSLAVAFGQLEHVLKLTSDYISGLHWVTGVFPALIWFVYFLSSQIKSPLQYKLLSPRQ